MNPRTKEWLAVFIVQLVLALPFYASNAYGLTISDVRVTKVTSNSATIEWDTDEISNGRVRYGKTASLGFTQRHDDFASNHIVSVFNGIDSDAAYFFAVESTSLNGTTRVDNNSNNFYTFKTTDITPPPQVSGLRAESATSSSIFLSWDAISLSDFKQYVIYRNRIAFANATTNRFNDTNLSSNAEFSYKVAAADNSGNIGPLSDTVLASTLNVDSAAPVISNADVLPITDTTARVTWLTNEDSTTIALYGINKTDKIKSSGIFAANHSIVIDGLLKNMQYIFVVKSCDASNNCANFSSSFVAGKDTTAPFINLSIPMAVNRRVIDITGATEPFTKVTLFVNDMGLPKRSLSNDEVGSSGKFAFSQIQLEQTNVIKIAMTDKSGNDNQKTFEVSVDTEDPIIQLNNVPLLIPKPNLTISGTANEPVTIKVFVEANADVSAVPSKVTGLNAAKIGQNYVELRWDESKDKDFSHYAVYRDESGILEPIALTKPANFNMFIDALVDSGKSYAYQVSAVNIFGNEGPKSELITVPTLKGGAVLNLKPAPVDVLEDFRKPLLTLDASGSFSFGLKLNKGDRAYDIKIIAEDRAQNSIIIKKSVTLDTKQPDIKIISPPSGAFIFENVANEVDIIGKTKPNARVHLFVDRTPFSLFNQTFEITGLPNEIQDLPEEKLDAKCRFNVAAKSFCSTGADFSVSADSNGNFEFENVDLTVLFGGAGRIREVPVTEFRDTLLNQEAKDSKKATLVVIATDQVGHRKAATQTIRIGTCWSGNQSWDIIPLTQYQSPALISTERLVEGTEAIYFYFNYSYIGRGQDAKITDIGLAKACSTRELMDPRFNVSCQLLPSGGTPVKLNKPDNTLSYSAIPLARFPNMDRFLEDDWKSFLKSINNELTFPLKVRITYEHEVTDENGDTKKIKETQTTCEQVNYELDNTIIDPRKVLPDWLLFDFVDFLQDSIKTLTDVQEQLDKLIDYVAVGCISSYGLNLILQVHRRWVSFWEEKSYSFLKSAKDASKVAEMFQKNPLKPANENDRSYCEDTIKKIIETKGVFRMKYMSDPDLRKCFPATASAWNSESKVYLLSRWSCDRVFGHAAPSRWTEAKDDSYLLNKIEANEGCAVDQSVRGQRLKAEKCRDLVASSFPQLRKDAYGLDDKCFKVETGQKRALFRLGKHVEDDLYEIEYVPGSGAVIEINYAIKRDEFNYLTARQKSCDEICGIKPDSQKGKLKLEGKEIRIVKDKKGNEAGAYCTTVDTCLTLNANKQLVDADGNKHKIKYAEHRGYSSDCFYDGTSINVISDNPSERQECCCINAMAEGQTKYYEPDDTDSIELNRKVHESKSKPESSPLPQPEDAKGYSDMKWSYRYWKEKFEAKGSYGELHKEYNPKRYIEGRDLPACFGLNNLLYQARGDEEKVLSVNPFRQHEASIQCVHLAGVSNRIQFIKNLMASMSTCLIQVRTTGRGDAGACKELFSQYLCGAIWQLVRWFVNGCAPKELGIDFDEQSDSAAAYLRAGFKGVFSSIMDLQSQVSQEYGNAKLNELLGTGEESIARKICLAAFGYDWEFDLRKVIDAAYATPFATLVQPVTRSREFLTVDPVSLKPKYEYRTSWVINPGCNFERYDIYLTCVGQKEINQYPNSVNCGALGAPSIAYTGALGTSVAYSQCDCINLPEEKRGDLIAFGKLRQNVLEDNKAVHKVIESNVRYDHLKFVLRTDRKILPQIKPNCFPTGYDDGIFYFPLIDKTARDIEDCTVDYLSGVFSCGGGAAFFSRKGTAELIEVRINDERAREGDRMELTIDSPLEVSARVTKTGKDKCLRISMSPDPIEPVYTGITLNGTNDVPPLRIADRLRVAGRTGEVFARNLLYRLVAQNNYEPVRVSLKLFDKDNDNRYSEGDAVYIDGQEVEISPGQRDYATDQTKISVSGKTITIEKEGAKIEIRDVTYTQTRAGSYEYQDVITLNPPQQTSQTDQQKTIRVELFHLKDDRESYNGPDDCNINDRIIERTYRLTVSLGKGVEARKKEPVISPIRIEPLRQFIGNPVRISTRITHVSGIKEAGITIKDLNNNEVTVPNTLMTKEGDNFEYIFDTFGREEGKYSGNIRAESREETKSNLAFQFELVKKQEQR